MQKRSDAFAAFAQRRFQRLEAEDQAVVGEFCRQQESAATADYAVMSQGWSRDGRRFS